MSMRFWSIICGLAAVGCFMWAGELPLATLWLIVVALNVYLQDKESLRVQALIDKMDAFNETMSQTFWKSK